MMKSDIRFLKMIYKIGSIMGVTPFYDFENARLKHTFLKKIQSVVMIVFVIIGCSYCIHQRYHFFNDIFSITNTILDAVCEFFLVSLTMSALTNNREEWLSLNNNFQNIDKMMFKRNQKESIFSNIYLHFVLYIFIVLFGICYMSYIWQIKVGSMMWHTYGMHELFSLYDGLLHFLIFAVAIALARRYEDLNQLLDVNPILNNEKFWNKHQTAFIRKIAVISRVLAEMIDSVNNIFGWSLVFMIGKNITQVLISLNYMHDGLVSFDGPFNQELFIANFLLGGYTLVNVDVLLFNSIHMQFFHR